MHYAASSGKADILEMLVEHGGQHMQPAEQMVNIKNAAGRTPLFAAVCESAGDNEAVSYLLSKGSDTHTYDNLHNTALLHRLSQYYDDNVETTKLLVEHRIESGASGYDLEFRNKLGETALLLACKQGLVQTTRFLIEKGADVNARDNRQEGPLDHCARASQDNGIEMASALIAAGADTRQRAEGSKDSTPLQIAISRRAYSERFLMLLLDSNADLEAPSGLAADRPLHSACLRGNLFAVEQLVARGADVNAKNKQGDTPLHLCDPLGKKGPDAWRIIPVLILNGADTSLRNSRGKLPVDTMKDARCKASFLEAVEQRDVQELAPILK
jgi:ankyrin repeat protein